MQGYQQQDPPSGGGTLSRLLIGCLVVGVIGISLLVIAGNYARNAIFGPKGKDTTNYRALGLDQKHADGDKMITELAYYAKLWKPTAVWWGVTYNAVGPDGTMDLTSGGATVVYAMTYEATSPGKVVRKDSIKDFHFTADGVHYEGTRTPLGIAWQGAKPPPTPTCTIKRVAKLLAETKGLTAGKTVRIVYDQQLAAISPREPSWHVIGEDPKIDAFYSMTTCAETFVTP